EACRDVLRQGNATLRRHTVQCLPLVTSPAEAVRLLADVFRDADAPVRNMASKTSATFGAAALPALIAARQDAEATVRCCAVAALGRLRSAIQSALPALAAALDDPEPAVRQGAVRLIDQASRSARTVLPVLMQALAHA